MFGYLLVRVLVQIATVHIIKYICSVIYRLFISLYLILFQSHLSPSQFPSSLAQGYFISHKQQMTTEDQQQVMIPIHKEEVKKDFGKNKTRRSLVIEKLVGTPT